MNADIDLISTRRQCEECDALAACRLAVRHYEPTLCELAEAHRQRKTQKHSEKIDMLLQWLKQEQPERLHVGETARRFRCGKTVVLKNLARLGYVYEPKIGGDKGYWRMP